MYLVELNCVPRLAKSKFRIYYLASFNYGWGQAGKVCQRVCAMALEDRMAEKNFSGPRKFCGFCGTRQAKVLRAFVGPGRFEHVSGTGTRRFTAATPTVGLEPTTTRLRALRSTDWARELGGEIWNKSTQDGREPVFVAATSFQTNLTKSPRLNSKTYLAPRLSSL